MRDVALKLVYLIGPWILRASFSYELRTASRICDSFTYSCGSPLYRRSLVADELVIVLPAWSDVAP